MTVGQGSSETRIHRRVERYKNKYGLSEVKFFSGTVITRRRREGERERERGRAFARRKNAARPDTQRGQRIRDRSHHDFDQGDSIACCSIYIPLLLSFLFPGSAWPGMRSHPYRGYSSAKNNRAIIIIR